MPDITVSTDIHSFMQAADAPAARSAIGAGDGAWESLSGRPANVDSFGSLANAAGLLANDGAGVLSYLGTSLGGNGAADSGKAVLFGGSGNIIATSQVLSAVDSLLNDFAALEPVKLIFKQSTGGPFFGELVFDQLTVSQIWELPNATGTIALLSDIPAPPSSIVGITGSLAEFNTALTGADFATLGANTFTALQQFSGTTHAGIRLNNLTTAERDAIASPAAGMALWNTTLTRFNLYNGSAWSNGFVKLDGDTMTGALVLPVGSVSAASLNFGTANTGIYSTGGTTIDFALAGVRRVFILSDGSLNTSGSGITVTNGNFVTNSGMFLRGATGLAGLTMGASDDLKLVWGGAARLQLGVDAAGIINQTLAAANRITSDGVGADLTIAGGRNRGASVGGSLIFQTSPAAGAGVTGTLATLFKITGDAKMGFFASGAAAPVEQAANIAAYPNTGVYATDSAFIKAAIDELRAALSGIGITA